MTNHIKAIEIARLTKLFGIGEQPENTTDEFYGAYLEEVEKAIKG